MQIHRFRHCAAIALKGKGETRYMTAATARHVAAGLVAIADSIDTAPFHKSGGGLTRPFQTFDNASECPESPPAPAAPDLLAALRKAEQRFEGLLVKAEMTKAEGPALAIYKRQVSDAAKTALAEVRAAIAKAEGGAA